MSSRRYKLATHLAANSRIIARNRVYRYSYLQDHPCEECGEKDPDMLTFHHKDPKSKFKDIAQLIGRSYSLEVIIREIKKCRVLCWNHHMKLEALERRAK